MGSSKGKMFHPQPGVSITVEPAGNRVAPDKSLREGPGFTKKGWINPGVSPAFIVSRGAGD